MDDDPSMHDVPRKLEVWADIPKWALQLALSDANEGHIESTVSAVGTRAREYAADGYDQYAHHFKS